MSEEKLTELQKVLNDAHENKIDFYESKRKEIITKRKQLSNRKQNMYDLLANKCITSDEYGQNNARYDEELSNLRRLEEKLDNADNNFYISVGYLLAIFQHAEKIFEVADVSEKRQIVSLIFSNLQLDNKNLIFNLKEPFDKLVSSSKGSYGWRKNTTNEPCSNKELHSFIKIYEYIKVDLQNIKNSLIGINKSNEFKSLRFVV